MNGRLVSEDIFVRLKAGTEDVHKRVEQRLNLFGPAFDRAAYVRLLRLFYGFWKPLELALSSVPGLDSPALGLEDRFKTLLLEADLCVLEVDPEDVPICSELPRIDSFAAGLGCLYVLEGSTLGAQFISKHIRERFNITNSKGGSFFGAYGSGTGKRWSEFRSFVISHGEAESQDEVVQAARETFESLDSWLCKHYRTESQE